VSDLNTLLQWEKKNGSPIFSGSFDDVNSTWTWTASVGQPNGNAFTVVLNEWNSKLDFSKSLDGQAVVNAGPDGIGCLAGHCDWRLPEIDELRGIVDTSAVGCFNDRACINPVFGPTERGFYWSNTTHPSFGPGSPGRCRSVTASHLATTRKLQRFVRAVRGGRRQARPNQMRPNGPSRSCVRCRRCGQFESLAHTRETGGSVSIAIQQPSQRSSLPPCPRNVRGSANSSSYGTAQ
jgi:Protein of unknown function (DUF1566)